MSDARAAILGRIDRALRTARIPSTAEPSAMRTVGPAPTAAGERAAIDRFLAEARALGIETYVEPSPASVCSRLSELVSGRRVLSWALAQLPYGAGAVLGDAVHGTAPRAVQAAAEIGVTGCHAAIAETGSLVLLSSAGCPRTASLLPPVHIAVVRPADMVATMGEFFAANAERMRQAASCTIVTGPSRTADIELSLTIGVHGPGRVIVIIGPASDAS